MSEDKKDLKPYGVYYVIAIVTAILLALIVNPTFWTVLFAIVFALGAAGAYVYKSKDSEKGALK